MRTTSDRVARSALLDPDTVLPEEHPQRLRRVERLPPRRTAAPDAALLIERQQAAEQVHVAVLVLRTVRQVGDRVVLAVAVLVELPVGVVEDQALAVGVQEIRILATHHLVERGGVLERETAARQLPPTLAPDLARRPQVPLVDQHEVVVAEIPHGDPLDPLLLRQLVQVDDLDRLEQIRRRPRWRTAAHGVRWRAARARAAPTSARSASAARRCSAALPPGPGSAGTAGCARA